MSERIIKIKFKDGSSATIKKKLRPRATVSTCIVCGKPLLDYETLFSCTCTKCELKNKLNPITPTT